MHVDSWIIASSHTRGLLITIFFMPIFLLEARVAPPQKFKSDAAQGQLLPPHKMMCHVCCVLERRGNNNKGAPRHQQTLPTTMDPTTPRTTNQSNNIVNSPTEDPFGYSQDDLAYLASIEEEASAMYLIEQVFESVGHLRDSLRHFAHKKGFAITGHGSKLLCSRSSEPKISGKQEREEATSAPSQAEKKVHHQMWVLFLGGLHLG